MITIIGIDHEYQNHDKDLPPDVATDQKCYVELLRCRNRGRRRGISRRFSQSGEKSTEELGVAHVVVDMNPAERVHHGIPDRYSDYDTRSTREEIECSVYGRGERFGLLCDYGHALA